MSRDERWMSRKRKKRRKSELKKTRGDASLEGSSIIRWWRRKSGREIVIVDGAE